MIERRWGFLSSNTNNVEPRSTFNPLSPFQANTRKKMDATGGGGGGGQTTSSSASSSNDAEARHAPYLRRSIELAAAARARGDHPFGALLFDPATGEVVAEGMNSVLTQRDCTGHVRSVRSDH